MIRFRINTTTVYGLYLHRITSRAFARQYDGVTERFSSMSGRNFLMYLSSIAVNGSVTDGVLVDQGAVHIIQTAF